MSWKYYRNSFKVSSQYLGGFTKLNYSAFMTYYFFNYLLSTIFHSSFVQYMKNIFINISHYYIVKDRNKLYV